MIRNSRFPAAPNAIESLPPPVNVQVYEILRDCGFAMQEAVALAAQTAAVYTSTTQRLFQFDGAVTIEISAGCATLEYAPRNYETAARTSEKIAALLNSEIAARVRQIREKRERDERRRPW
jgi:hypothetical protein